jgi:hypothetical protein
MPPGCADRGVASASRRPVPIQARRWSAGRPWVCPSLRLALLAVQSSLAVESMLLIYLLAVVVIAVVGGVVAAVRGVQADAALLERVVANLVDNARRFSPNDVPVRVHAAMSDAVGEPDQVTSGAIGNGTPIPSCAFRSSTTVPATAVAVGQDVRALPASG